MAEGGGDCGEVAIGGGEEFEESWEESERDGKVRVGSEIGMGVGPEEWPNSRT